MGRRGSGEGAVYWIESRQLWAGAVEVPSPDGHRTRKVVKAKLKKDVLKKMREVQGRADAGIPQPSATQTTGQWLTQWLTEILPGTVTAKTEISYRQVVADYVMPSVGKVPLARLSPDHVQRMMRTLQRRDLSPRTVAYARAVLRRALGQAVRWDKVQRNVAALVEAPPKAATKLDDALDADEAAAVLRAASGDRLEALAVLVLMVGLREGEALALRWDDVDLVAGRLTVTAAKTTAGLRTVALPARAVDALKAHRAHQAAERLAASHWIDLGLVFPTTVGTKYNRRNILRWWHNLTIKAGVGRRRFHASRHTAATLMLNNGVALEVVSATLGHAGLAITADVYARVGPELQRTAADAMDQVLGAGPASTR
jgi:integrase